MAELTRDIADTSELTDGSVGARFAEFARGRSDTVGYIASTGNRGLERHRVIADTVAQIPDRTRKTSAFGRQLPDTPLATDSVARQASYLKALSSPPVVTADFAWCSYENRDMSVVLGDSVLAPDTTSGGKDLAFDFSDTDAVSDDIQVVFTLGAQASDSAETEDGCTREWDIHRIKFDEVPAPDFVVRACPFVRECNDTIEASDAAGPWKQIDRVAPDTADLGAETLVVSRELLRSLADAVGVEESLSFVGTKGAIQVSPSDLVEAPDDCLVEIPSNIQPYHNWSFEDELPPDRECNADRWAQLPCSDDDNPDLLGGAENVIGFDLTSGVHGPETFTDWSWGAEAQITIPAGELTATRGDNFEQGFLYNAASRAFTTASQRKDCAFAGAATESFTLGWSTGAFTSCQYLSDLGFYGGIDVETFEDNWESTEELEPAQEDLDWAPFVLSGLHPIHDIEHFHDSEWTQHPNWSH